jgi:hypothetical protein
MSQCSNAQSTKKQAIKKQAILLAKEHKKVEPDIQEFWWFPCADEIRLVEVESQTLKSPSDSFDPFFFEASPLKGWRVPFGIAIIRPDEVDKLSPPSDWGDWKDAQRLEIGK